MTHFYMTLPSNSSLKFYPENTLARFITKLHSSVSLSGEWEVALSEIHFPRTWYTIESEGARFIADCKSCIAPPIDIDYYNTVDVVQPTGVISVFTPKPDMIDERPFEDYTMNIRIQGGYYESMHDLVSEMNTQISKEFSEQWMGKQSGIPRIKYSELNKRTYFNVPKGINLKFDPPLTTILGLGENQSTISNEDGSSVPVGSEHVSDINGGIHSLYVYCDLLEYVTVGDTSSPLLRVVDARGRNGNMQHRIYEPPRYIPLQKKTFDCVEIEIRDDLGHPIPFESGKLTVILHFRRAKNPYFL